MKTRAQQFQEETGLTFEQAKNLLKNPQFAAEQAAYKEVPASIDRDLHSTYGFTPEQTKNLLKNPQFSAERAAFARLFKPEKVKAANQLNDTQITTNTMTPNNSKS